MNKNILWGVLFFTLAFIAGCEDDDDPFVGSDNFITSFILQSGETSYVASFRGDTILMETPENVALGEVTPNIVCSENSTIKPEPSAITNWEEQIYFVVTSHSGKERKYIYIPEKKGIAFEGVVVLNTQEEVDAFGAKGVSHLDGSLVIGRQGELFQLVPFDTEAWHAGRSCYGGRANLNRYSIGIELDNLGRLQWQEGRFVAECGVEVAPADVYVDDTGELATFWHRYTERQKRLLREICRLLKQHYPIRYVVGHSDITDRKQDPGPELHGFMCK